MKLILAKFCKPLVYVVRKLRASIGRVDRRLGKLENAAVRKYQREASLPALRMAACEACPELSPVTKRCRECGCFMPAKVYMAGVTCPQGKW